ncbi:MAG: hypothetical protein M3161_03595, partial [Actinomycetota bacterium]|nr:hypothetical protein [Actinomycetota bacterium]
AAFQITGFIGLETAERLATGHSFMELVGEPVLWIGIVLQIAVALLGASLVRCVARLVTRTRRVPHRGTPVAGAPITRADITRLLDPDEHPLSRRGPPALV